jgi:hypothetical protein
VIEHLGTCSFNWSTLECAINVRRVNPDQLLSATVYLLGIKRASNHSSKVICLLWHNTSGSMPIRGYYEDDLLDPSSLTPLTPDLHKSRLDIFNGHSPSSGIPWITYRSYTSQMPCGHDLTRTHYTTRSWSMTLYDSLSRSLHLLMDESLWLTPCLLISLTDPLTHYLLISLSDAHSAHLLYTYSYLWLTLWLIHCTIIRHDPLVYKSALSIPKTSDLTWLPSWLSPLVIIHTKNPPISLTSHNN